MIRVAVRRESVRLDLEGNFLADVARAAAGTQALRVELDRLGRVRVDIGVDNSQLTSAIREAALLRAELDRISQVNINARVSSVTRSTAAANSSIGQTGDSINQLTGRLSLLADGLLVLGPGLIPIAAVGAQALGGLAAAATSAAVAGASVVVAFQGVGDAIEAANDYALEPTADNFAKMQEAMSGLAPAAQKFVREFQAFRPVLTALRDSAATGLFPGLTRSLDDFERLAPSLSLILRTTSTEVGSIVEDAAASLASPRWSDFMTFLADEVPTATRSLANIMGDLAHGIAELMMAFDPGSDSFLEWAEGVASAFDGWASSSAGREDIADFLAYARESGPEVAELFSALVGALAAITEAAAPIGGTVLEGLTAVAKVIEVIADSDMATPIIAAAAALRIYSRLAATTAAAQSRLAASSRLTYNSPALGAMPLYGRLTPAQQAAMRRDDLLARRRQQIGTAVGGAAGLAALGLLATGTADKLNLTNTATLTLAGSLAGPLGAAAGAAIGFTADLMAANNDLEASIKDVSKATVGDPLETLLERRRQLVEQFSEVANAGTEANAGFFEQFGGNLGRISSFLSNDPEQTIDAIEQLDELIRVRRELDALGPVNREALVFNDLFGDSIGQLRVANSLLEDFAGNIERAFGFLSRRAGLVAYEEALDGINAALEENGKTLDVDTEKGRANIQALDAIADAGLRLSEQMKGASKQRFLDRLEVDVRKAAAAFGMGGKELRDYLNDLALIGKQKVRPELDADDTKLTAKQRRAMQKLRELANENPSPFADLYTNQFDAAVAGVRNDLRALDGDSATTYVNIVRRETTVRSGGEVIANPTRRASGGLVTGPGGPRDDRIPALLSNGEFVVNAAATARNLSTLYRMNAQRFAEGGRVGGSRLSGLEAVVFDSETASDVRDVLSNVRDLGKEAKKSKEAIRDEARERRRNIRSYSQQVRGSLAGELTGGGLAGLDLGLAANRNDAKAMVRALIAARKKGLSGPLFDLVAASGDLSLAQQMAELSRADIARRERQYGATRQAERRLGDLAAAERYGRGGGGRGGRRRYRDELSNLTNAVAEGAYEGTSRGSKRASRNRARATAQRVKARR